MDEYANSNLLAFAPRSGEEEVHMTGQIAEIPNLDQAKTCNDGYVLIVAPEEGFLDYYRRHFVDKGFTSLTAPTHDAALALMRLLIFDLIVVDERTGAVAGPRILERGRELGYNPVILAATRGGKKGYRLNVMNPESVDDPQEHVTIPEILRLIEPRRHSLGQGQV